MGSSQEVSSIWFDRSKWNKIDTKNNYDILVNKAQGTYAQEYTRNYTDTADLQRDVELFKMRLEDLPNVVRFYHAEVEKQGHCGSTPSVKVVTERIPTLLSDVNDLSEPELFKVMEDSLRGFEAINKRFYKNFTVSAPMIGFNKNQEVRTWLNRQFYKNQPEFIFTQQDRQNNIITSLYNTFQSYLPNGRYP